MAEMPTATVELKPPKELLGALARLEALVKQFEACAIRVLSLQPGDVVVLEAEGRISEAGYVRLRKSAEAIWPDNRVVIFEDGVHVAGLTRERDSSGDWRKCLKCGARWSGLTGKYEAP